MTNINQYYNSFITVDKVNFSAREFINNIDETNLIYLNNLHIIFTNLFDNEISTQPDTFTHTYQLWLVLMWISEKMLRK